MDGFEVLVVLFFIMISGFVFAAIVNTRKSKQYRKQVMDMYVAAKTRFLAKRDNLDIDAEEELFKKWQKKIRAETKEHELDDEIEEDLKEKISEPVKKK